MTRLEALETSYLAWLHDRPLSLEEFIEVSEHFIPEELEDFWQAGWVWDFQNNEAIFPGDTEGDEVQS